MDQNEKLRDSELFSETRTDKVQNIPWKTRYIFHSDFIERSKMKSIHHIDKFNRNIPANIAKPFPGMVLC